MSLFRRVRPDLYLVLGFWTGLWILGSYVDATFFPPALRYYLGIVTWYLVTFWAVVRSARLGPLGHVVPLLLGALVLLFSWPAPGTTALATVRNIGVLAFPVALGLWARARERQSLLGGARMLGELLPFLLSEAAYLGLHDLVHRLSPIDRDDWLIRLELLLFKGHLSLYLESWITPLLTDLLSAAYSLLLFFPLTLALIFQMRGQTRPLRHLLTAIIATNFVGYLGYLGVPAIGPMYTLEYSTPLTGGWFFAIKESMDQMGRIPRDCFPSLHTGLTVVVLWALITYQRRLLWVYLLPCLGCIAATIYLRYHYTIDVVAGALLGSGVFFMVPRLVSYYREADSGEPFLPDPPHTGSIEFSS